MGRWAAQRHTLTHEAIGDRSTIVYRTIAPTDGSAGSPSGSVDTGNGYVLSTCGPRLKVIGALHAQVGGPRRDTSSPVSRGSGG
jgi:hypothetical protein